MHKNTISRSDFLNKVGVSFGAIALMRCLQACEEKEITPQTNDNVDFSIDLSTTEFKNLTIKGSFVIVSQKQAQTAGKGGGITNYTKYYIVIHTKDDLFLALNGICTHQLNRLTYNNSSREIECDLHGSRFDESGKVIKDPATKELTSYKTSFDKSKNILRVYE